MIKTVFVSFVCLAAFAAHAERKYEYKCWVAQSSGQDAVVFYKLDTKRNHSMAKHLALKAGHAQKNKKGGLIQQVHECAELEKPFLNREAKELDRVTLR